MRRSWLETATGLNVVAVGLAGIMMSLLVFTFVDFAILFTGKSYVLHTFNRPYYLLWASIATVFSFMTAFIWRRGWPRILIVLFGASMASHILFQFIPLRAGSLELVALCRILIAAGLVALFVSYRFAERRP